MINRNCTAETTQNRGMIMTIHCNFCNKSQHELKAIVVNKNGNAICDKCVDLCIETLADKEKQLQRVKND